MSVTICGEDLERAMEAEGDAGFKCSSGTKCQKIIFIVMFSSKLSLSYFLRPEMSCPTREIVARRCQKNKKRIH